MKKICFLFLVLCFCITSACSWSTPVTISGPGVNTCVPQLGLDSQDNATVVWKTDQNSIQYSENSLGSWSAPANLFTGEGINIEHPIMSSNSNGDLLVTSIFDQNNQYSVKAIQYLSGVWEDPATLSNPMENGFFSQNTLPSTFGMAIWIKENMGVLSVQCNSSDNGSWSSPTTLSENSFAILFPLIAASSSSNALAIWQELSGFNVELFATSFDGTSWSTPEVISQPGYSISQADMSMNLSGNALAAWISYFQGTFSLMTSFWNGDWSSLQTLAQGSINSPQIAINGNDNGACIWSKKNSSTYSIEISTYSSNTWSTPVVLFQGPYETSKPQISMNDNDEIAVTWYASTDGNDLRVYTCTFSEGSWSTPEIISDASGPSIDPQIALNNSGQMACVWTQSISGTDVTQASTGSL